MIKGYIESQIRAYFESSKLEPNGWVLLFSYIALLFILSLIGVMALRSVLLVIALVLSLKYIKRLLEGNAKKILIVLFPLILLMIYMLFVSLFIAKHPLNSLAEWKGQWLTTFGSFIIGLGLASALSASAMNTKKTIAMAILIPVTLYMLTNAIFITMEMIRQGQFLTFQAGISMHKAIITYLIAMIEPLIVADSVLRFIKRSSLFPFPAWMLSIVYLLILFSLLTAGARNGFIILLAAFILGFMLTLKEVRKIYPSKNVAMFMLASIFGLVSFVFISYKLDPRWNTFVETIPVAWNIDNNLHWISVELPEGLPKTASGVDVDVSAYQRIAWVHVGWRLFTSHLMGTEISRAAFSHLVKEKYPEANIPYIHNGWLDFGIQVGLPGVFLWGWFLFYLGWFGWRSWKINRDPLGLSLAILIILFALRGLLDEIFREQMIVQFALVSGLLLGILWFYPDSTDT